MKKLPITSEDREMLKCIYKHAGKLDVYFLHEKFLLSPGQLSRLIRKFTAWNVITEKEGTLYLTELGQKWLLENERKIFCDVNKYWKECPDIFKAPQLNVGTPYLPDFSIIDKEFFRNIVELD